MIDLRKRGLPDSIETESGTYRLDTDFRKWIEFEHAYRNEGVALFSVFAGKRPKLSDRSWVQPVLDFLASPNETPRSVGGGSAERAMDMVLDGEYIVASFQAAYGIDLTDPLLEMHWHRFKALLNGLPDDAKMSNIMGHRTWRRETRKHDEICASLKRAWALPEPGDEQAMADAQAVAAALYEEQIGGARNG